MRTTIKMDSRNGVTPLKMVSRGMSFATPATVKAMEVDFNAAAGARAVEKPGKLRILRSQGRRGGDHADIEAVGLADDALGHPPANVLGHRAVSPGVAGGHLHTATLAGVEDTADGGRGVGHVFVDHQRDAGLGAADGRAFHLVGGEHDEADMRTSALEQLVQAVVDGVRARLGCASRIGLHQVDLPDGVGDESKGLFKDARFNRYIFELSVC